jgi:hypothetical protein
MERYIDAVMASGAARYFRTLALAAACIVAAVACNAPPMYHTRARTFLTEHNVDKLMDNQPLTAEEVSLLVRFDNVPTLHLVGGNPGTPVAVLEQLATHRNEEVRRWWTSYPSNGSSLRRGRSI